MFGEINIIFTSFPVYLAFLFGFRQTKTTSVALNALPQSTSLTNVRVSQ